jgi:hypothetical protein
VVANYQAQLVTLSAQVIQWQSLDEQHLSAQAEYNKAGIDLNAANAAVASNQDPSAVSVKFAGHVSRLPEIARFAGVAAGVALLLSLGYLVFMEFLHPAVPSVATGGGLLSAIRPVARRPSRRIPAGVTKVGSGATKVVDPGTTAPPVSEAPKSSNGEL